MFASRSLAEHIVRGAIGLGALATATIIAAEHPWLSITAIGLALVALRGCPMCWTVGLVETLVGRRQGDKPLCRDGSCARQ